ncbi:unnamed protein product, partial [Adineta steineri]
QFRSSSHQWKDINVINSDNTNMRDKESIQNEIRLYVKESLEKIKSNNIEELWKDS